jgi:hypothetical protein
VFNVAIVRNIEISKIKTVIEAKDTNLVSLPILRDDSFGELLYQSPVVVRLLLAYNKLYLSSCL